MRGAVRLFIESTTPYKVCDAVDNDVSAIHKATENHCDLVLLHLTTPLQDSLVTVSLLRSKLPHVKIVGFSALSVADLGNQVSPATGFDAVIAQEDGLSKLVETLNRHRLYRENAGLTAPRWNQVGTKMVRWWLHRAEKHN